MKTIQVTDKMHASLMELSRELNTQDHRATAMPYFFQVRTTERQYGPEGIGEECYVYDSIIIETAEEIESEIFELYGGDISRSDIEQMPESEKDTILTENGWRCVHYELKEEYQNAFFTAKACKANIAANKHHYTEPVDFLSYGFRNPELELVLKFLCELSGGKLHK